MFIAHLKVTEIRSWQSAAVRWLPNESASRGGAGILLDIQYAFVVVSNQVISEIVILFLLGTPEYLLILLLMFF